MSRLNILSYFPKPYKPREVQRDTLLELEQAWDKYDVFVINLPVASGKSYIAKTISDYTKAKGQKTAIITPTNLLVDQYRQDFPTLTGIVGKAQYPCSEPGYSNCLKATAARKRAKCRTLTCSDCPWRKDNMRFRNPHNKAYVTNYHLYISYRKYMQTLIADEAHNLVGFLQEFNAVPISRKQWQYPRPGRDGQINRAELKGWLDSLVGIENIIKSKARGSKGIRELYHELRTDSPKYLIKEESSFKDGEQRYNLKLCPIDIRAHHPIAWPQGQVSKLVLMSATISPVEIKELGLDKRRVKYIEADSCIPAEQRPVVFNPVASVTGASINSSSELIAKGVCDILKTRPESKGLVHVTYAQSRALQKYLRGCDRIMFHDKDNKKSVYTKFRQSTGRPFLIAAGMQEGIDLPGEDYQCQIIGKVPYPDLSEPAVRYRSEQDKQWYSWQATKTMLQACGRICRTPSDFGETIIIDSNFKRLYQNNPGMYPGWFKKSVSGI